MVPINPSGNLASVASVLLTPELVNTHAVMNSTVIADEVRSGLPSVLDMYASAACEDLLTS